MTLQLDERRVAMLQEMGLRLLPPLRVQPDAAPAAQDAVDDTPVVAMSAAPVEAAPAPVTRDRPAQVPQLDWDGLREAVAGCRACGLCESRRNTVFGVGPERAEWMVVGEAPGEHEDAEGEPFVGQSGKLLDNMLRAIGLDRRRNVYIANVLKCRPPGNRNPEPHEMVQCEPFLRRQIELLQPRMILAMGRFAVQSLLRTQEPVGRLRGKVHEFQGVPLVVTYHPAYLLRNLPDKAKAWADLCRAAGHLEQTR
jgi:DNA polymerase